MSEFNKIHKMQTDARVARPDKISPGYFSKQLMPKTGLQGCILGSLSHVDGDFSWKNLSALTDAAFRVHENATCDRAVSQISRQHVLVFGRSFRTTVASARKTTVRSCRHEANAPFVSSYQHQWNTFSSAKSFCSTHYVLRGADADDGTIIYAVLRLDLVYNERKVPSLTTSVCVVCARVHDYY